MNVRKWLRISIELAIMIGMIVAIDVKWAGGTAFAAVNPNPLWLPVLVMALAYGSGVGLIAAGVATCYWIAVPHAAMALDDSPFHYLLSRSLPPLMWVAASVAIGELTYVRLRRIASLERLHARAMDDLTAATSAFRLASENAHALNIRIAMDEVGVGRAIEAAAGLFDDDRTRVPAVLARLIAMDAQAEDFTVYTPVGGRWRAFTQGPAAADRPDHLPQPLVDAVLAVAQALIVNDPAHGALLAETGVFALPVRDARGGACGILMFHHLPPERFSRRGIIDLDAVAGRLGMLMTAVGAAEHHPRLQIAITSNAA